jgi:hypothetical protein
MALERTLQGGHPPAFELSTLGIFTISEKLTINKLIASAIETKIQLA